MQPPSCHAIMIWSAHYSSISLLLNFGATCRLHVLRSGSACPALTDHEALGDPAGQDPESGELVLRTADGTEISLPSSLLRLVVSAANNLAAGRTVMAIPAEVTLTPAEAGTAEPVTALPGQIPRTGRHTVGTAAGEPSPAANQAGRRAGISRLSRAPVGRAAQNRRHSSCVWRKINRTRQRVVAGERIRKSRDRLV
jgi:hypothetical protein